MITLTCPKCRQQMPDAALDAGQCSACGFPLDGPIVLGGPESAGRTRLLIACVSLLAVVGAGYAVGTQIDFRRTPSNSELAALPTTEPPPVTPVVHVAPFPHEPKPPDTTPPPAPVDPPKPDRPRSPGVVMKVNPKIAPVRHFDHPDDTAALPDLNSEDRVTLAGKVRTLRLGSVNGKGFVDASGLVAEEVVITGDLNGEAQVLLNAPGGKVTAGGYVVGASKLTVVAPGGTVVIAKSGRVAGGAKITATAKRFEVHCPMSGGARIDVTLTTGGALKLTRTEEGATVVYTKADAADPPPAIEKGELHGGGKVVEGK